VVEKVGFRKDGFVNALDGDGASDMPIMSDETRMIDYWTNRLLVEVECSVNNARWSL